jgi:hypothetical protein
LFTVYGTRRRALFQANVEEPKMEPVEPQHFAEPPEPKLIHRPRLLVPVSKYNATKPLVGQLLSELVTRKYGTGTGTVNERNRREMAPICKSGSRARAKFVNQRCGAAFLCRAKILMRLRLLPK